MSAIEAFAVSTGIVALAEIGDKTQFATIALAAQYQQLVPVVLGTTLGMMLTNVPAVLLGERILKVMPVKRVHQVAALLFAVLGVVALMDIQW
jgi:putative Ca2+/H+ antiporter (TMEM165/GDT1 family)